jgi:hypothetical protein
MSGYRRSLTVFSLCLLTLFVMGSSADAKNKSKRLEISNAFVDWEAEPPVLVINGYNFGKHPAVWLDETNLEVISSTSYNIECRLVLPEDIGSGTFRLLVAGKRKISLCGANRIDTMDVTIGAGLSNVGMECSGHEVLVGFTDNGSLICRELTPSSFDLDGDGYTTEEGDCDDADARVHPGQTQGFVAQRPGGGWDYDCNSIDELTLPNMINWSSCESGWEYYVPQCGQAGTWHNIKIYDLPDFKGCGNVDWWYNRRQSCR